MQRTCRSIPECLILLNKKKIKNVNTSIIFTSASADKMDKNDMLVNYYLKGRLLLSVLPPANTKQDGVNMSTSAADLFIEFR